MNRPWSTILRGAAAGTVATVPMSAVMFAADRAGLVGKHPPELIAEKLLRLAGVSRDHPLKPALATTAHFGFGLAAGALFGSLRRCAPLAGQPVAQGIAYGLAVYAVSYGGWVPAANVMPEPEHDRPGRQATMVAAHVVYGAALGALAA